MSRLLTLTANRMINILDPLTIVKKPDDIYTYNSVSSVEIFFKISLDFKYIMTADIRGIRYCFLRITHPYITSNTPLISRTIVYNRGEQKKRNRNRKPNWNRNRKEPVLDILRKTVPTRFGTGPFRNWFGKKPGKTGITILKKPENWFL